MNSKVQNKLPLSITNKFLDIIWVRIFIVFVFVKILLDYYDFNMVLAFESNVLKGFEVKGNQLIPEKTILINVKLKPGDILTEEAVQKEINNIAEMGYFSYVGAEVKDTDKGKILVFNVVENAVIGDIHITGCSKVSNDKILAVMESKLGTVFNSKLLSQDIQNINEFLAKEGYIFSRVTDAKVEDQGSKILIEITEGRIADIKIEGLKKTKEKVIRRELTIKPGDIYDNKVVVRDLQRVFNLGFFEEVKRDHLPGPNPNEVVLVIQVVEQKTGRAGIGGGYSSLNGIVGFANISQNNFNGEGKRVYLKTEFGGVKTFEVGYFDPWLNNKPKSLGIDIYNTKYTRHLYAGGDTLTKYDEKRKGGSILLGKRIRKDFDLSLRFRDEDITLKPTDSNVPIPAGVVSGRLQTLGLTLDIDTRDNRFSAKTGRRDTIWLETTGGLLIGPNQYTKLAFAVRRYFPLNVTKKLVFASQIVGGRTTISKGFVPIYDMFFIGGSDTVRGYKEREFLGTKVLYTNLELRQNIAKNFGLVAFYDIGSTWGLDYNRVSKEIDWKKGFGIGIRLITPLGPVAIDHGKATDRGEGRTYFNFGSSF